MAGILKVRKRIPTLIAIPTTAGTGSETTLAAVMIDSETRHKFAINDFPLIPRYAVLAPEMIHTLPPSIAAETGIDALTHAVEAYIGRSTTKGTRADAMEAVRLVFENLDKSCNHESTEAEAAMLRASHLAGRAFTRSYVGYVHAVSHSLSGKYNLPHGRTNATLLPVVLRMYGSCVHKKLARLAVCAGLGDKSNGAESTESVEVLAEAFISAIEKMNTRHGIPEYIPEIKEEDIGILSRYAAKEANPLYPVPKLWDAQELESIYRKVMKTNG
jgi:alcohol dehydrogenase class IV